MCDLVFIAELDQLAPKLEFILEFYKSRVLDFLPQNRVLDFFSSNSSTRFFFPLINFCNSTIS